MERMTSKEFVHTLVDIWNSSDRRICFVLGAGASKSSGIKTGAELATQWLEDIKARMNDNPEGFKKFIKEHGIDEKYPGTRYPEIYKERYKFDIDSGFDFINRELEKARPGYGYSVLAQILADRQHNIVITTNFDSLTEEALYTYSSKRPLICGHESLAVFAKPSVKRPLIVKIHRDRFLSPQSQPDEIERINELWVGALNNIFSASTPVFIGYGGNDGSLMGYMGQVAMINNMFWCVRKGSKISEPIETLLKKHKGNLVEIEGFDELMFSLQDGLKLKLLDTEIVEIAQGRSKEYKDTVGKIRNKQAASPDKDVQKAAERIVDKAGDSWWSWELKAQSAKTNEEKESVYRDALKVMPESVELNGNYALFLESDRKNYDEAEKHYLKALSINPDDENNNANYALFLGDIRKNYDEAEKYYLKALSLDSEDATNNGNYALFLGDIRKNYDEAEKYYLKALSLDPEDANNNGNYGIFLKNIRKNYDEAEKYYLKALSIDSGSARKNNNYALFLRDIRKNYDEAEKYYLKALSIDPENKNNNGNYAFFLESIRKNYDEAEKYYLKAISVDSEDADNVGNYALFLHEVRKNYDEAEKYYLKALSINPEHGNNNGNYALFLESIRKNYDGAEKYYLKTLSLNPESVNNNGNYALFLHEVRKNYDEAEKYYRKALALNPEHAENNESFALFLKEIRKDYNEAGKYYRKALSIEPENENYNANYAGFLFHRGNIKEATVHLEKAFQTVKNNTVLAELWFYSYAHIEKSRDKALKELKNLVCKEKIRSISFDLQENVDYAIKNNHPNPKLLQLIADIITKDVDASGFCKK
jgi:tetratricopeptide (TPR) repeat protein